MNVTSKCICDVVQDYLLYNNFCCICGKPSEFMKSLGKVYCPSTLEYYVFVKVPYDELKRISTDKELTSYCFSVAGKMREFFKSLTEIR